MNRVKHRLSMILIIDNLPRKRVISD